jgi:hypothetical protein
VKALLITVVVLLGLLVVADRVTVRIAEQQVAQQIARQGGLAGNPSVDITGFPFLTQAVSGRYDDIRIGLTADELGQPAGTRANVSLRGVHVALTDALSGSVSQIPVDRVDGTATISYSLLAAQLGGNTSLRREGSGLRITKTVTVLGQKLPLTASGTVRLSGNTLAVDVHDVAGAGVQIPRALVGQASHLLDISYKVPALPFGLKLTSVVPADDGAVVTVAARDTVLRR